MEKSQQILKHTVRFVLLVHMLTIIFLAVNFKTTPKKHTQRLTALKERVRKIERPIATKPKFKAVAVAQKASPAAKSSASGNEVPKKNTSVQSKSTSKKSTKKSTVSKQAPKVVAKKEAPKVVVKKEELVALKSPETPKVQKIKETQEIEAPIVIPQHLAKLSVESLQDEDEGDDFSEEAFQPYYDYVINQIRGELDLCPGSYVVITLSLNKKGEILEVRPKEFSDEISKEYALSHINGMRFAAFFGEISKEPEYTFNFRLRGTKK